MLGIWMAQRVSEPKPPDSLLHVEVVVCFTARIFVEFCEADGGVCIAGDRLLLEGGALFTRQMIDRACALQGSLIFMIRRRFTGRE